ncbi:adenosylcobinamide-GDP ribazoletransferase [Paractinoplanes brasiliensis]|uniref:Adenosylcobinamide-GDP ribazoletransferase n=1 Tax=Paractinoplanes brasiliensis TaxID=52695 RepID=A0A4V3C7I9_9ACTN|nr:adenosylcobinamide-GDP ribazoletransferase [Actinoplanes brasiliensis]TDO37818.1 cobalamin-5'-phosphate synthase [Actinoplanes brasiliensis]GID32158.1 adenosylcobinamide-GDP ribazoletransferase [Actinoplanes brasiliensis]
MTFAAGLRLSITTLTVLPVRAGRIDRPVAAVAMSVAPAVGAALGTIVAGLLWLLREAHAPALLAGAVTVAAAALLTRGMHLDGLADTIDALGSYRRGEAALDIMKKPDIGPFGVAAIALTLLIQAAALSTLPVAAVIVAFAAGRAAIPIACRRGVPAARPEGLGALVAGTVPVAVAVAVAVVVTAAAAIPGRTWQGPVAVAVALPAVVGLVRHAVRRFGGITGDVLGAAVEIATTLTMIALTLG